MICQGKVVAVKPLKGGIIELNFDFKSESVNKFNRPTLNGLRAAVDTIKADVSARGVIVVSGKDVLIIGVDITKSVDNFQLPDEELMAGNLEASKIFNDFEDLDAPIVATINGIALGSGLGICLAVDFRVMSATAKVGLLETKLGIYSDFGDTVRLPRPIDCDNAVEWIALGKENKAEDTPKVGAVDVVIVPEQLQTAALDLAKCAVTSGPDYKARHQPKLEKLKLNAIEQMVALEIAKGFATGQAGPNCPAPVEAIKSIQKATSFGHDKALEVEAASSVKLAKTSITQSLIGLFLNNQELKKKAKKYDEVAKDVKLVTVLGIGIVGGGIAYRLAPKGTPILMKDIREEGVQMGLDEAAKLLGKCVEKGHLTPVEAAGAPNGIHPTIFYGGFSDVDIVVGTVIKNSKAKQTVLIEVESAVKEDAIIVPNTSTISINLLARALKRPKNLCGMHFFNPIHMMSLMETIRGEKTGETVITITAAYAKKMGKSPIVINGCPGPLVSRVLLPYFGGLIKLLSFDVDFIRIDKVTKRFGRFMGLAYLPDVAGIDTGHRGHDAMAEGFPDRMAIGDKTVVDVMYEANRLGQKNGKGFYAYETDKRGKPKKATDLQAYEVLKPIVVEQCRVTDEDVVNSMMIPLCLETVHCLKDDIVETAAEAGMGLIYNISFPPFHGDTPRYIDSIGVVKFIALADKYAELGALYHPTARLHEMVKNNQKFFG